MLSQRRFHENRIYTLHKICNLKVKILVFRFRIQFNVRIKKTLDKTMALFGLRVSSDDGKYIVDFEIKLPPNILKP